MSESRINDDRFAISRRNLLRLAGGAGALIAAGGSGAIVRAAQTATSSPKLVESLTLAGFNPNQQRNFNPFSPTKLVSTIAFIYEPLYVVSSYGGEQHPWLATGHQWQDNKTLVMNIRQGVKWSDGTPFSAKDVEFTFNMLKQHAALDIYGLWTFLSSVTADNDKVVFKYSQAAVPTFIQVASQTQIVPQHIWSKESDPVKFTNPNPVTTGPYTVKSFTAEALIFERNPTYWQADKVAVKEWHSPKAPGTNQIDQLNLSQGKYDWTTIFVPDIEKVWVSKDPQHNHYWFPGGATIGLYFNLTKAPFNDVKFREAIAYGIDRDEISKKAEFGYVKAASQIGLFLPGQKDWLDPSIPNQGYITYDADKAAQMLTAAGYKKNGDKLVDKAGKEVAFTMEVQNGYTDWIAASRTIQENLGKLGISMTVRTPSPSTITNDTSLGNYEAAFGVYGGSPDPYLNYFNMLYSKQSAPVGKPAASNYIRWQDPTTDQLLDQLRTTLDQNQQKQIVYKLEKIMVEQFPAISLWYGATWGEYSTKKVTGWPSAQNPYALPAPYLVDALLVVTNLKAAAE